MIMTELNRDSDPSQKKSADYKSRRFQLGSGLTGFVVIVFFLFSSLFTSSVTAKEKPLFQKTAKEIIANYTFINDFYQKESERAISSELFWRYPLKIPKTKFKIEVDHNDVEAEVPRTMGSGRAIEHMNKGRIAYLNKDYQTAKNIFLTARARYGAKSKFHRRNDYFIGISFMQIANQRLIKNHGNYALDEVQAYFANAATFLSWAFVRKKDVPDPFLDQVAAKSLYNLAAIYYQFDRFSAAHAAAMAGLDFLRGKGTSEYRPALRRMVAEGWIKNRSYLKAVQELDTSIRQDPTLEQAASAFVRVGDIYFDLNNYELAEDAYGLSIAIDRERRRINPAQMILRGEALFWLGDFSQSQKMLDFGLKGVDRTQADSKLPANYGSWAKLRIADGYLARAAQKRKAQKEGVYQNSSLMDKAKLAYFQVEMNYPKSEAAKIAKIRRACLELPYYAGKNINHARELLNGMAKQPVNSSAIELSWACKTASYVQRERTKSMVDRVRKFAEIYPESGFLNSMAKPVLQTQVSKIDEYFKNGKKHLATIFFEKNRKILFKKISSNHKINLFESYVDIYRSGSAVEFWDEYATKKRTTDLKLLRSIVFASEVLDEATAKKKLMKNKKDIRKNKKSIRMWRSLMVSLIKKTEKAKINVEMSPLTRNFVNRVLATSQSPKHLNWIYQLVNRWTKKNKTLACNLQYPVLSKMVIKASSVGDYSSVVTPVLLAVDQHLPGLLEVDFECGSSLLELESQVLSKNVDLYKSRWMSRLKWPLAPAIVKHLWNAAESLFEFGEKSSARIIWKHLSEKGPKGLLEVRFSKIRLDKNRTEFEGLWE